LAKKKKRKTMRGEKRPFSDQKSRGKNRRFTYLILGSFFVAVILVVCYIFRGERSERQTERLSSAKNANNLPSNASTAPVAAKGKILFENNCMKCHGPEAQGSEQGPTFLHSVYHPNHHSDASFLLAVRRGVRQHHWKFGDMLPVPNISEDDVKNILQYVRALQRKAGIF
jgi:cytochrome c551/c552